MSVKTAVDLPTIIYLAGICLIVLVVTIGIILCFVKTKKKKIIWQDEWTRFYKTIFGRGYCFDFSKVEFPPGTKDSDWIEIIPKGLGLNKVIEVCDRQFSGNVIPFYGVNFESYIPPEKNDRDSGRDGSYATRIGGVGTVEICGLLFPVQMINACDIAKLTLIERIIFEMFFFYLTHRRLEVKESETAFCNGTRYKSGEVPRCYWQNDKLFVGYPACGDRELVKK